MMFKLFGGRVMKAAQIGPHDGAWPRDRMMTPLGTSLIHQLRLPDKMQSVTK